MNQRKAGVFLSYINMGVQTLIGFIYVPLLLSFLSQAQYGLYQLVGSMIAYIAVMDFGLANTTIRYYSRYRAQNDVPKQENLLATMLRLYMGIGVGIILVGCALLYFLLPFYHNTLSETDIIIAKQVYRIMLLNLAFTIPGHIFSAVIQAHEQFIFLRLVNLANIILQPVLVFIVLHFKASIVALVLVQTACNLSLFCTNAYYVLAKLKVRFHLHKWEGKFVKEILLFSFFIFLNIIMDQIYWKTGQLILGAVVGTAIVAVYSVAVQLCMSYMGFSANISSVFLPHLSSLATKGNIVEMNKIFLKVGRLQFYIVMLLFWGFFLFGKQFLHLWVGDNFLPAYTYALLLMGALIIPLVQNTGILILQAQNKHAFRAIVFVIISILNVCISIPLAKYYGALACASVTAGCLLLGQGLILNIYYEKLGLEIGLFFKDLIKIGIVMLFPVGLVWGILTYGTSSPSIFYLFVQSTFFVFIYSFTLWFFCMNKYEKNLILTPLKKSLRADFFRQ